jgi:hypothetical protein
MPRDAKPFPALRTFLIAVAPPVLFVVAALLCASA